MGLPAMRLALAERLTEPHAAQASPRRPELPGPKRASRPASASAFPRIRPDIRSAMPARARLLIASLRSSGALRGAYTRRSVFQTARCLGL